MKDFSLIVAIDLDGAIGHSKTNDIPWHLPGDFQHFKDKTTGKTVVMGSRTWDSLPKRPLPNRRNIVISQQRRIFEGADFAYPSLEEAIEKEDDVMIMGGSYVYEASMRMAPKTLHITIVNVESKGDVKFVVDGKHLQSAGSFRFKNHYFINTYRSPKIIENKIEYHITEWVRVDTGMKHSSDAFQFHSVQDGKGITTTLTKVETGETKVFFKADGSLAGITNHMNSLTDELCDQWFAQKKKGKKGK
jgi:dihydrofolate reductase